MTSNTVNERTWAVNGCFTVFQIADSLAASGQLELEFTYRMMLAGCRHRSVSDNRNYLFSDYDNKMRYATHAFLYVSN